MTARRALPWLLALALSAGLGALLWVGAARLPAGALGLLVEGRRLTLADPRPLALLGLAPLLLLLAVRSLTDLPGWQRALALALRLAFLAALGLALGRPAREGVSARVAAVVALDVSDSVPDDALADAREAVDALIAARRDGDQVRVLTWAARPRLIELLPGQGGGPPRLPPELRHAPAPGDPPGGPGSASDTGAALRLGAALFPPGHLRRLVLASDGADTGGDLLAEAERLARLGVRLHAYPARRAPPAEVALTGLTAPARLAVGAPFELSAQIRASRPARVRARLTQGALGTLAMRELELPAGDSTVKFPVVAEVGGEVSYRLALEPETPDRFAQNNALGLTVDVPGRPQVLLVAGEPRKLRGFGAALTAQGFEVDLRPASAAPASLEEIGRFDFVVLADVPREALPGGAEELLTRYVRELGGGFLMAGGQHGFGLGGWGGSVLERLLPVKMDVEHQRELPNVALALVIDRSGSMVGLPLEMAKSACQATLSTLEPGDLIEVIAFDSTPVRAVRLQPARYKQRIQADLARIQPGGGTELLAPLDMALQDLTAVAARKKHVIFLTDGRAGAGGLRELGQAMAAEGITLTTVSLGGGADAELLRQLAQWGGGRHHAVPDPASLPRIFTRETELVAKQAAVEEWFPVQVVRPADWLRGVAMDGAPLLHGHVATTARPDPARVILASDRGEPILAEWRVGLGVALAWTSDLGNLWASEWLAWSEFGQLWGQLVRENRREKHHRELALEVAQEGDEVRATVDAFTAEERFDDGLVSRFTVVGPAPDKAVREVPMRQIAPGRYQARFVLDRYGSFTLRAEHRRPDAAPGARPVAVSVGRLIHPYPAEYARLEPDRALLSRAVALTGGGIDPPPAAVFDPAGEQVLSVEPWFGRCLLAALGLFVLDLLLRRVRLGRLRSSSAADAPP